MNTYYNQIQAKQISESFLEVQNYSSEELYFDFDVFNPTDFDDLGFSDGDYSSPDVNEEKNEKECKKVPKCKKTIKKAPKIEKKTKRPEKVSAQKQYAGQISVGFASFMIGLLKGHEQSQPILNFLERLFKGRSDKNKNKYKMNKAKSLCLLFQSSLLDTEEERQIKTYLAGWLDNFLNSSSWLLWFKTHYRGNLDSKIWMLMNWEEISKNLSQFNHKPQFCKVPEDGNLEAVYEKWLKERESQYYQKRWIQRGKNQTKHDLQ